MRKLILLVIAIGLFVTGVVGAYLVYKRYFDPGPIPHNPPTPEEASQLLQQKSQPRHQLGSNTNEVVEDNASIPFLNLFKSAIPFANTHPWLSSKEVVYDKNGWPIDLKGGVAGTKFLNRLPAGTVPDGIYTVIYDGNGEVRYGNDARLHKRLKGRDLIEINAGSDQILNASLVIEKLDPDNPLRNIRILPPGGICKGQPFRRVLSAKNCGKHPFLAFARHYKSIPFNPDYLNFMKDFSVIRFMNQSGMTRNPVENWQQRNTMDKATWAGKEGQRGAPLEMMVALANTLNADAWFSMPHRANDEYIRQFAEYVAANLKPQLRVYIEYSNEVWNNIFIHRRYAMDQGIARGLDTDPKAAAIKFQAQRSLEIFNTWHDAFGAQKNRVIRTLSGWSANKRLTSQLLSWKDMHRNVDAFAIAPYFYADLKTLRKAKHVDDIFAAMMNERSRYGLAASIRQIREQAEMAKAFGVHLIAYEGGQHLVDWETRKLDQHPNPLLLKANRDPRMGELYQRYLSAWQQSGAGVFVHFSAPRIPGWYGSWGAKEFITQPREQAPKYDALLRHLGK